MKESYLFDMSFNNVIFKGRNMAYGAYILRSNYNRHIAVAALIGSLAFTTLLATPIIKNSFWPKSNKIPATAIVPDERTIMDIPIMEKPKAAEPETNVTTAERKLEKIKTEKYVAPKVVDNSTETPDDVPDQAVFENALIGAETQDGLIPSTPTDLVGIDAPSENGTGAVEIEKPYIVVEEMPQFGKNEADLANYLSRNIRYPSRARSAGIEGLVIVTFVVSAQGEVQEIEVLKGLGYGTEEEALRVVKGMPNWKPGRQNGRAVPVRYTLPIRLQIQN